MTLWLPSSLLKSHTNLLDCLCPIQWLVARIPSFENNTGVTALTYRASKCPEGPRSLIQRHLGSIPLTQPCFENRARLEIRRLKFVCLSPGVVRRLIEGSSVRLLAGFFRSFQRSCLWHWPLQVPLRFYFSSSYFDKSSAYTVAARTPG